MKIDLRQTGDDFELEAVNEQGNKVQIDSAPEFGGHDSGLRPMQLLLCALGGCSAIDVISILKKQKEKVRLQVSVEGLREKEGDYSLFRSIHLHFRFSDAISPDKARRAIALSLDKYCSVAKTLEPTARISYDLSIDGVQNHTADSEPTLQTN